MLTLECIMFITIIFSETSNITFAIPISWQVDKNQLIAALSEAAGTLVKETFYGSLSEVLACRRTKNIIVMGNFNGI